MCVAKEGMSVVIPSILICDFHADRGFLSLLSAFHRKELRNLTNALKSTKESGRSWSDLEHLIFFRLGGQNQGIFRLFRSWNLLMFQIMFVACLRTVKRYEQDVVSERRGVDGGGIIELFGEVVYALTEGPSTWSIGARASTLIGRLKK